MKKAALGCLVVGAMASSLAWSQSAPSACIAVEAAPITLTEPGHYCLTKHVVTSSQGVRIAADDVTLNLNGFTLRYNGPTNSIVWGVYRYAAAGTPEIANVTVRNGTIANFYQGVMLQRVNQARVEDLRIQGDATRSSFGIDIYNSSAGAVVRGNQIANVAWGIQIRGAIGTLVQENVVQLLGTDGRQVGIGLELASGGTLVRDNVIRNSSGVYGTGIVAYSTTPDALLMENSISSVRSGISVNAVGVKYKNNVVTGAVFPYQGGTNLGGNQ